MLHIKSKSAVSYQKGPTRHAYAWQIGPFWQDILEIWCSKREPFHVILLFYVTWCRLTTGIVASQCPPRDPVLVTPHFTYSISACLIAVKTIQPQPKMFTMNLRTSLKVMLLILTSLGDWISLKWCKWLAWKVQWHALALVTHEITWQRVYVAYFTSLVGENCCHSRQNPHRHIVILALMLIVV